MYHRVRGTLVPVLARGYTRGSHATITSANATIRLLRDESQSIAIQLCRGGKCIEASVNPRSLYHALYAIATDTLGESIVDILERAREALWSQLLADRATFTLALQKHGKDSSDTHAAAARLIRDWEVIKMIEDILAMVKERGISGVCNDGDCVKAALEICHRIDDEAGNANILRYVVKGKR